MMSSIALLMLVLVAECYCAPGTAHFGNQINFTVGTNLTTGFAASVGKNKEGVWTVDGEVIAGANVTGEATLVAYAGLNDHIVSIVLKGGGTVGIEARPGIHLEAGMNHDGAIKLHLQPRLPINLFGSPGYNGELAYGEDAREVAGGIGAFIAQRANDNKNMRDNESHNSVQKSPSRDEHTKSPYRVHRTFTTEKYNNDEDYDEPNHLSESTTAVATLE